MKQNFSHGHRCRYAAGHGGPPTIGKLPAIAGYRAFEDSTVVTESAVVDEYITQRLNELHTTPENLPALQKVVLELIHKARLTTAVFKQLRGIF